MSNEAAKPQNDSLPDSVAPPLVSVVMPVYRPDRRFFPRAVDSVLRQTLAALELIIVEDASEVSGREMLGEVLDPRIRYVVNSERTSLPRQHNTAVSLARAPFIARFDADDICEPNRLEEQRSFLERHPAISIVGSQVVIIDEDDRVIGTRRFPVEHDRILKMFLRTNPLSGSNVTFRREVVDRVGGWREDSHLPGQDYEWFTRAALAGFRFANHPAALIRYRVHRSQIKSTRTRDTIRTSLEVKEKYWRKRMGAGSRIYMELERIALILPQRLVLWIVALRYRRPGRIEGSV